MMCTNSPTFSPDVIHCFPKHKSWQMILTEGDACSWIQGKSPICWSPLQASNRPSIIHCAQMSQEAEAMKRREAHLQELCQSIASEICKLLRCTLKPSNAWWQSAWCILLYTPSWLSCTSSLCFHWWPGLTSSHPSEAPSLARSHGLLPRPAETYRIFAFQSMDFLLSLKNTHLKEEEEEIMDCCQGLHKHIYNLCISFNGFCTFLKNTHL